MVSSRLAGRDPRRTRALIVAGAAATVVTATALSVFVHPVVGIAAVIALGAAPVVLGSVDLAFLAVVAVITLLPFAAVPLGFGFNPTFLDIALLALYGILALRLATREQASLRWPPLSVGVLLLLAMMLLAFLVGTAQGTPTRNEIRTFAELVLGCGLFFVVANLVEDRGGARRAYLALVACGGLAAAVGLVLYVLPDPVQVTLLSALRPFDYPSGLETLRFINDDPTRLQRATGTSIDPNSFGGMLAVIAALLAPQAVARTPIVPRRWAMALLAVTVTALLATVSRGSLLGFAAALGVLGLARDRRLLAAAVLCALGLLLLAQVLPWTGAYVDHFVAGIRIEDRATQMRAGEYRDALRLVSRYPVLGVGFGAPRDVDLYRGVSMLYLIIAETMGLVGLAAFLGVMAGAVTRLTMAWRDMRPSGLRAVVLGCLAAVVASLTSGLVDHYFFTYPHAFALLWLVVGLGMSTIGVTQREGAEPAPGSAPSSKEEEM